MCEIFSFSLIINENYSVTSVAWSSNTFPLVGFCIYLNCIFKLVGAQILIFILYYLFNKKTENQQRFILFVCELDTFKIARFIHIVRKDEP